MAKKREPAWVRRLRDLLDDFKVAKKRSRLRFWLIQTTRTDIEDLQPSYCKVASRSVSRTAVTLGDGTAAQRIRYRFGSNNDPAVALIERGNDILDRHGDVILKLFGLKFVRTWESNWPWLLEALERVPHPFRGDMQVEREWAGYFSGKEQMEAWDFEDGRGPKPNWWDQKHQSFRADIPHVAVASIAAIRAILERVAADSAETPKIEHQPPNDGPFGLDGFRWRTLKPRTGLPSTPFRLLRALWTVKDRTATFDDLAEHVWDDKTRDGHSLRNDSRLGSARREVNEFMEAGAFPFRVRTSPKNGVVSPDRIHGTTNPANEIDCGQKCPQKPAPRPPVARAGRHRLAVQTHHRVRRYDHAHDRRPRHAGASPHA